MFFAERLQRRLAQGRTRWSHKVLGRCRVKIDGDGRVKIDSDGRQPGQAVRQCCVRQGARPAPAAVLQVQGRGLLLQGVPGGRPGRPRRAPCAVHGAGGAPRQAQVLFAAPVAPPGKPLCSVSRAASNLTLVRVKIDAEARQT